MPWQRSLRWSKPLRDRRLLALGVLIAVLVTVLELLGFGLGMRAYPHRSVAHVDRPIEVSLIDSTPPDIPPPPPEPEPPPLIKARASKIAITPPKVRTTAPKPATREIDPNAMSARIGDAGTAPPPAPPKPLLFNADGSVRLDADSRRIDAAPAAPKNPQEAAKARWAEMEKRGENPLHCKRTRFAKAFTPDQDAGDAVTSKYLKWIGLADTEAIAHRQQQREQRAADGCDPAN